MKSIFERGLAIPSLEPQEPKPEKLIIYREEVERARNQGILELANIEDMAERLEIDLANDYDERMKNESYVEVRDRLLALKMDIVATLETSDRLLESLGGNQPS